MDSAERPASSATLQAESWIDLHGVLLRTQLNDWGEADILVRCEDVEIVLRRQGALRTGAREDPEPIDVKVWSVNHAVKLVATPRGAWTIMCNPFALARVADFNDRYAAYNPGYERCTLLIAGTLIIFDWEGGTSRIDDRGHPLWTQSHYWDEELELRDEATLWLVDGNGGIRHLDPSDGLIRDGSG